MRIHPLCLLLLVAVSTSVRANTTCIVGCKCYDHKPGTLKIQECDSPLYLTSDSLSPVSKKITVLKIENVVIKRIDQDAFKAFEVLETIVIEDTTIDSVHKNAFDLPELERLTFKKTTFGEIPEISAQYIEELIFNYCKLTKVPKLDGLPAVGFLNLANNLIEEIDESTFDGVNSLEEVTLANNSISKLPPNLFSKNPDFNVLNLDNNPLTSLFFDFNTSIEYLSLNNCNLTTLDRHITDTLKLVSTLQLSGNNIAILPIDAFEPMKELNTLDLSNNKLVELDDNIFSENSDLDTIRLDNNHFENLPKFRTKAGKFQTSTFSCKNCGLDSLDGVFDNMQVLETLDLSNNNFKDIDGVFSELRFLKKILLANNQISTIGINSFGLNSQLETLDLSNNPLLPLDPVVFASIPQLKTLNVTGANLVQLWTNHNAQLPALEQLFADRNKLSVVSVEDVKIIPNLQLLGLKGNPLICDDTLLNFVDYVAKKKIFPNSAQTQTHADLKATADFINTPRVSWAMILPADCGLPFGDDYDSTDDDDIEYDEDGYDDDGLDTEPEYDMDKDDAGVEASVMKSGGFNLAKASYILSITSVFILTALLVLFVAVVVTLLILKRNKSFNMHNGNLPRLKIPLWHATPGQKKHSGSVYKPLSEELGGPRTPIINRYEFATPKVHNSLP